MSEDLPDRGNRSLSGGRLPECPPDGSRGHRARRRFGQNFLIDTEIIERIVQAVHPLATDDMLEIGPGLGALTRPLLARLDTLTVLEIDRDLCARFQRQNLAGLQIVEGDALSIDFAALAGSRALRIVGNLPYNIGTPLLIRLLDYRDTIEDIHVMLQKEVVDRLVADVGQRTFGRLSVLMQTGFAITRLFDVPSSAFEPAPKVQSAVVRLRPRPSTADPVDMRRLSLATRLAFASKRKTLRNNLKAYLDLRTLEQAGIDPGVRAETLSLEQFVTIAKLIHTDER